MTEIDVHVPEGQMRSVDSADLARAAYITLVGALGSEVFDRRVEGFFLKPLEELAAPGVDPRDLRHVFKS